MDIVYKERGYFSFKSSDSLRTQTKKIPDGYGVYVFHKNERDGEILYIGKSGTILQNGCYEAQCLRDRLNNSQCGMGRKKFLRKKMEENKEIQQIFIEWYIIDEQKYIPAFIEALLLQDYYTENSCLPIWNNKF